LFSVVVESQGLCRLGEGLKRVCEYRLDTSGDCKRLCFLVDGLIKVSEVDPEQAFNCW